MARVIQQRSAPPYLLIAFVFLFVLATAMAVVFYVRSDKAQKEQAKLEADSAALANAQQLKDPSIVAMIAEYRKKPVPDNTVVRQFIEQKNRLCGSVKSMSTDTAASLQAVEDFFAATNLGRAGLVDVAMEQYKAAKAAAEARDALNAQLAEKDIQISSAKTSEQETLKNLRAELETQAGKIKELERQLTEASNRQVTAVEDKSKETAAELSQERSKVTNLVGELNNTKLEVDKLKKELEAKNPEKNGTVGERPVRPDGKVTRVEQSADICYIDLGRNDHVQPDISFAVYPPAGDVSKLQPKGRLLVLQVMDTISKCRIVQQDPARLIEANDVIGNIAFDRVRAYSFLVRGRFDLYGSGRPKAEEAEAVKGLIQRFGGKIVDMLDPVATDYVILGDAPEQPKRPEESAAVQVWQVFRETEKYYKEYNDTKAQAQKLGITVLSYSQFADLTGYVPQDTLTHPK